MTISLQNFLKEHAFSPKKAFSQNFLKAEPTINRIAQLLSATRDDTVLEIGSGPGFLTVKLAEIAKKVIAVEKDEQIWAAATKQWQNSNILWLNHDILELDLSAYINDDKKTLVIGNLPYAISSPIIFWLLDNRRFFKRALVMLQKEVADRLAAGHGCKDYGIPSVLVQAYSAVKKVLSISANNFIPPPDVSSCMVEIAFEDQSRVKDEVLLADFVRTAFSKRRKTMLNALKSKPDFAAATDKIEQIMKSLNIDLRTRAEDVSVLKFVDLANILTDEIKGNAF